LRVYVRKRIGPDGQELRKDAGDNPLKKFGITLIQANVQDVDPDPGFKKKLLEHREAAAQDLGVAVTGKGRGKAQNAVLAKP
jgi:hypothetical protein